MHPGKLNSFGEGKVSSFMDDISYFSLIAWGRVEKGAGAFHVQEVLRRKTMCTPMVRSQGSRFSSGPFGQIGKNMNSFFVSEISSACFLSAHIKRNSERAQKSCLASLGRVVTLVFYFTQQISNTISLPTTGKSYGRIR